MPEMFENKAKFAANSGLLVRSSTQLPDIPGVRSEFMIRPERPLRGSGLLAGPNRKKSKGKLAKWPTGRSKMP